MNFEPFNMDFDLIINLEKKLLNQSFRKNKNELNKLLSDDFIEFGTSGRTYDKTILIQRLAVEDSIPVEAFDFNAVSLSPSVVHLRFKTRHTNNDGTQSCSLRSSIWKFNGTQWQMLFHQGTSTTL
jgi:hypothetical protein